jgi:HAE1 family hydrophobic/amphiphilic exporter-1
LVGAKVKSASGILGTAEDAPIALIVTGTSLESAMVLQKPLRTKQNPSATGVKLSVETGNPEINVKVDRDKMAWTFFTNCWYDHANCL